MKHQRKVEKCQNIDFSNFQINVNLSCYVVETKNKTVAYFLECGDSSINWIELKESRGIERINFQNINLNDKISQLCA